VLRIEPTKEDQAESAILELVDSPRDMRFAMTAKILARLQDGQQINDLTARNIKKVTQFRHKGWKDLEKMVEQMKELKVDEEDLPAKRKVYPEPKWRRDMHIV
jgi:large subunit ribosomal protein L17